MNDDTFADIDRSAIPTAVLEATRALLYVTSATDAQNVASTLVRALGGDVAPVDDVQGDALPIDVSFGEGSPLLPRAPRGSVAAALLERFLPSFVIDARRAIEVHAEVHRFSVEATTDGLTTLANRRMVARALGRLRDGDTVIMVDLDHFKRVNDTYGHAAGDETLRTLGRVLHECIRGRDFVGRYGGEEFVIVLSDSKEPDAFLTRLRDAWIAARPYDVSFSAGIAVVAGDPAAAIAAADGAMYAAKRNGRNRWNWALDAFPVDSHAPERSGQFAGASFVAWSQIEVPEEGRLDLEQAFANRLGAVDRWPGFIKLEVWADVVDATSYIMVSWWTSPEAFKAYMRSDDHRLSHRRIPIGEFRPHARHFRRYRIVAR
ncbi:MAG: diguanylate cyclase [Acidimicrobiales bacterium]